MSWTTLGQVVGFLGLLLLVTKPLGAYMAGVFQGNVTFLSPLEYWIYRLSGVRPQRDQHWTAYAGSFLAFGLANFLLFYVILRFQGFLPLNPQRFGTGLAPPGSTAMTPDLAFNTSVSFLSNTSWQSYAGENTLSYFSQMAGVCAQSFTSAGAGMAVAVAMIRGFAREGSRRVGNFWVDLTRSVLYVLLPLSLVGALLLCAQGVVQTIRPYGPVTTLEGAGQTLAWGPVASQESIKLLSSDGGGFLNANSAHPFENPTPLTNLLEMLLILAIPAGFTYALGRMLNDTRQGWALFTAMLISLALGSWLAIWCEQSGNPLLPVGTAGNLEGKEVRFGVAASAIFSVVSTASSDGAVNSAHDSYTPLGGLVQMFNLKTGEVIFGGTGSGLVSMLLLVLLTVFIAGLMVGRTPEYLGKRIERTEMKLVMLSFVTTAAAILLFSSVDVAAHLRPSSYWNPAGPPTANLGNRGPHGLSEILYANASASATNGSAFSGLNSNTPWFNITLGMEMLIGRFLTIIPALAIAGSLARKQKVPVNSGTMPTNGPFFVILLLGTIFLVTALAYLPAFSLGPVAEHYLMHAGVTFP